MREIFFVFLFQVGVTSEQEGRRFHSHRPLMELDVPSASCLVRQPEQ